CPWREVFLEQKLRGVGNWLKQTGWPDAIRPEPVLHERADATLRINRVGNHRQYHDENHRNNFQKRCTNEKIIHCRSYRPGGRFFSASSISPALGSTGGGGDFFSSITAKPRSPILLKVRAMNCGISVLIWRNTSSIVKSRLLPPSAWRRSRKISQSSRAFPGGRTARFKRCNRPSPLIIEPRFSAKPDAGKRTVACSLAGLDNMSITTNAGRLVNCSEEIPIVAGFSPNTSSTLIARDFTASAIAESFPPGSESSPRIIRAPAVFGFRSLLSKMPSPSPKRGTMSM